MTDTSKESIISECSGCGYPTHTTVENACNHCRSTARHIKELKTELAEMTRRRDAWRARAEGYDAVRLALREKVGAPWPPNLSRGLWAGIAADEKKRADDAEAKLAEWAAIAAQIRAMVAPDDLAKHMVQRGNIDEVTA